MSLWNNFTSSVSDAWDYTTNTVSDAYQSVFGVEDEEAAPQSYGTTAAYEASASGATATTVPNAQTNTGETVVYAAASSNTPLYIGGAVLVVVLLGFVLMMRGK